MISCTPSFLLIHISARNLFRFILYLQELVVRIVQIQRNSDMNVTGGFSFLHRLILTW